MDVLSSHYESFMSESFQLLGRFVGYCFTFSGIWAVLSGTSLSQGGFLAWSCKTIIITSSPDKSFWGHALSRSRNMKGETKSSISASPHCNTEAASHNFNVITC